MIECIFTIDYEIYGNGQGSCENSFTNLLARIKAIFEESKVVLSTSLKLAELQKIEATVPIRR